MAGGRPTKYKKEYCKMIEEDLAKGYSVTASAALLNVHKDTLYEWARKHPEFSASIKRGIGKSQRHFEKLLAAKVSGQTIKGFDQKKSDLTGIIFALKTRFFRDWGDIMKHEIQNAVKIIIDKEDEKL
jgi:transposase